MQIPRVVAIHEAGHAVAHVVLNRALADLGFDPCFIRRIVVRTRRDAAAGPYIDRKGGESDCVGGVEVWSSRYSPLSAHIDELGTAFDIEICGVTPDNAAEFRAIQRRCMEADVVELLAGPSAEARYSHQASVHMIFENDWDVANLKAKDFARNKAELSDIMNRLSKRAAMLVRNEGHWSAINALADELLARRELTGDEAYAVIRSALVET